MPNTEFRYDVGRREARHVPEDEVVAVLQVKGRTLGNSRTRYVLVARPSADQPSGASRRGDAQARPTESN